MATLTDATAHCIGEAPIVSSNSPGKEHDAEFGNGYFGASCCRPWVMPGAWMHRPHHVTSIDGEAGITRLPLTSASCTERLDDSSRNHLQVD
jgi:hypothetical protein